MKLAQGTIPLYRSYKTQEVGFYGNEAELPGPVRAGAIEPKGPQD